VLTGASFFTYSSIFLMLMLVPDVGWRKYNGFAGYSNDRLLYAADPPKVNAALQKAAEREVSHDAPPGDRH
jgi:hypothetical protein